MSHKTVTLFVCSKCGAQFPKWSGRCLECGSWGALSQQTVNEREKLKSGAVGAPPAEVINFGKIKTEKKERFRTGISEFDRVLGGGFVPGSLVLLSGEPGIGKSTVVAQIADAVAERKRPPKTGSESVIYVSGEESIGQIKSRLERLHCRTDEIAGITETNIERIISAAVISHQDLLIIDSIQTIYSREIEAEAGSIAQIRACTVKLLELAKKYGITVMIIGHVTKDGAIAGPKSLEHIVDTVIYLESERTRDYRILRAVKNRFGSVNELGIFAMTGVGFKEVKNPASIFLEAGEQKIAGSVISCVLEGTRPFLVEIQALVTKTVFGYPQRKASGFDLNRLQVLTAVLTKRAGVNLTNQDVILNVVGGLKINDPGLDLAVCLAVTSSLLNQIIDRKTLVLGEVGLGGEIRHVRKLRDRLREAEKLGFTRAMIPVVKAGVKGMEPQKIKNLGELVSSITHNS